MGWAAIMELSYAAAAASGGEVHFPAESFLRSSRAQMACLYCVSAFWKLTSSFFDFRTSCAHAASCT